MKTFKELLNETGRTQYVDEELVSEITPTEEDIEFFRVGRYISNEELSEEYKSRNLIPASPYSLALYDIKNRDELDKMEWVGTHFKDAKGSWYYAAFCRFRGGREVRVRRHDFDWGDDWWFAGVRKSSTLPSDAKESLDTLPLVLEINGVKYKKI